MGYVTPGPGTSDVRCVFLGAPKSAVLYGGSGVGAGSVVGLKSECTGFRRWWLVVAHVEADTWLCADGSHGNGEQLCLDKLFNEELLQVKDVVADAWAEGRRHQRSAFAYM